MLGEDDSVGRHVTKVVRNVAGALGPVHDEYDPMVVQDLPDRPDLLDRTDTLLPWVITMSRESGRSAASTDSSRTYPPSKGMTSKRTRSCRSNS